MRRRVVRPKAKLTRYLTLAEAAKELGVTTRKLRRHLQAVERRLGRPFLVRLNNEARRPSYQVTIALLRRHCPELFDSVSEAQEIAANRFSELEDAITEMKRQKNAIAARIRQMNATIDSLIARLNDHERPRKAA